MKTRSSFIQRISGAEKLRAELEQLREEQRESIDRFFTILESYQKVREDLQALRADFEQLSLRSLNTQDDQQRNNLLIHLHIPRTGGISVRKALSAALGADGFRMQHSLKNVRVSALAPAVRCISGHFNYGLHVRFPNSKYLIILRHPVSRVLSLYWYIRKTPGHKLNKIVQKEGLTIAELLRKGIPSPQFENAQVRQLNFALDTTQRLSRAHLENAKRHLSDNCIVGFEDSVDETVDLALSWLGVARQSPHSLRKNVAPRGAEHDAKAQKIIEKRNGLDIELYEWARKEFGFS